LLEDICTQLPSLLSFFASRHQFAPFVRFLAKSASEGGWATASKLVMPFTPKFGWSCAPLFLGEGLFFGT